jgi:hypothetical protein
LTSDALELDEGFIFKVRPWQTKGTPPKYEISFLARSRTATGLPSRLILFVLSSHLDWQRFPAEEKGSKL